MPRPAATAATEPPAAATRAIEILAEALENERAERRIVSAEIRNLTERAVRAEARAEAADRERARADELANTLIALRASWAAECAERDRLKAEVKRLRERRWYRFW